MGRLLVAVAAPGVRTLRHARRAVFDVVGVILVVLREYKPAVEVVAAHLVRASHPEVQPYSVFCIKTYI